jgi:lipopolysaccharide/colanic/teichoic acid biosynthesis glycosyltransferase
MYLIIKRIFDISFSVLILLIISPLFIPISILLLLTGEGYIFYKQERVGFLNKKFKILKFATMLKNSPNMTGGIITTKNDPRLTPLGGFLRKTKINELPQLINILKGDISFIGPRPVMKVSFEAYPDNVKNSIYNVLPGLTGIGSIIFRNEESIISDIAENKGDTWEFYNKVIYPYKGEVEMWYLKNQSFFVDLILLVLTFLVILFSKSNLVYLVFKNLPPKPKELL